MRYLLDTDSCSYIIKKNPAILEKFRKTSRKDVAMSAVTCGELYYGASREAGARYMESVAAFCRHVPVVDWSKAAAILYGRIHAELESEGQLIGKLDMQIAAHALALKCTLVTNNEKHFKRIPKSCRCMGS